MCECKLAYWFDRHLHLRKSLGPVCLSGTRRNAAGCCCLDGGTHGCRRGRGSRTQMTRLGRQVCVGNAGRSTACLGKLVNHVRETSCRSPEQGRGGLGVGLFFFDNEIAIVAARMPDVRTGGWQKQPWAHYRQCAFAGRGRLRFAGGCRWLLCHCSEQMACAWGLLLLVHARLWVPPGDDGRGAIWPWPGGNSAVGRLRVQDDAASASVGHDRWSACLMQPA